MENFEKKLAKLPLRRPSPGLGDRIRLSKPNHGSSVQFKRRRTLMKSLLAITASLGACVALWWAIERNHNNSLYAQVIDAARKARTVHMTSYAPLEGKAEPVKTLESWYESGVGFRRDVYKGRQCTTCLGNEDSTWTLDNDQKNTVRSRSRGITSETEQIFIDIECHARELQNHGQRYAEGDQTFDGQPCKAYRCDLSSKTGNRRELTYLDQQSRLVRVVSQERDGDRWNTSQFCTIVYDESLDSALFQPSFDKGSKIVDADTKSAKPDRTAKSIKPEGPVLIYEIDPNSKPANPTASGIQKLLKVVEARLNGGAEKLAAVRKLDDRRIEVKLMRRNDADRQRVERQLTRPGTLEFRILANNQVDKALIDRAQREPGRAEVLDPSGKRLAWWVPVRNRSESDFRDPEIARRSNDIGNRMVTEILVIADPCDVTGVCLTLAKLQFDHLANPIVSFQFNDAGGELFGRLTGDHLPNESTGFSYRLGILVDGELFSAPTIRSKIGNQGQITGSFTEIEASDLAAVLNAGCLPVQLRLVREHSLP